MSYKYGITEYKCGSCPECLQEKSRNWALRCSMEAKNNVGMMMTLTYDTYVYDNNGNIIGEQLPSKDMRVSKSDLQKFFKRLRHFFPDKKLSYLAVSEYGKRTHRPHYHILLFGLVFDDLREYKRSKRGNLIYRSPTLEKIWHGGKEKKGGICTVDCTNINAKTARYCTKYCAKDNGIDDTFMLFSRGIGESELLKRFNGKSYWIEGREYLVPKKIWTRYIEKKYDIEGYSKYINPPKQEEIVKRVSYWSREWNFDIKKVDKYIRQNNMQALFKRYFRQQLKREYYSYMRDNDTVYKTYIQYWKNKTEIINRYKPSVVSRILALPVDKYRSYKAKALKIYNKKMYGLSYTPPRVECLGYSKSVQREKGMLSKGGFTLGELADMRSKCQFAVKTRHNTANDSKKRIPPKNRTRMPYLITQKWLEGEKNPFEKYEQQKI